jgi:hypothetical protein
VAVVEPVELLVLDVVVLELLVVDAVVVPVAAAR